MWSFESERQIYFMQFFQETSTRDYYQVVMNINIDSFLEVADLHLFQNRK